MQTVSLAQPWGSVQVKGQVVQISRNYKTKTEVGFASQRRSSLRTRTSALFGKENRNALGHHSGFFAGDNDGFFNFRYVSLDKRREDKVGVVMAADKAKDYYSILNVSRTASDQDIKAAYEELYREYHSHTKKSPEAEENFKEIGAAFEVLSDEVKRLLYDQNGVADLDGAYEKTTTGSRWITPIGLSDSHLPGSRGHCNCNDMKGGYESANKEQGKNLSSETEVSAEQDNKPTVLEEVSEKFGLFYWHLMDMINFISSTKRAQLMLRQLRGGNLQNLLWELVQV